jgi:hypothetical protein
MRINVYSQELLLDDASPSNPMCGRELELIAQTADSGDVYSAVRMFLKSPMELHDWPGDDDRSAITFWLPKTWERRRILAMLFRNMASYVEMAPAETGMD